MVYFWKVSEEYPQKLIGQYDRTRGPDRFAFKSGEKLDSLPVAPPRFIFEATRTKLCRYHDLANNAMIPLVSPSVVQIVNEICPSDIQFVPAIVDCLDEPCSKYSIAVATRTVRGLDHEKSSYSLISGTTSILGFRRAVYDEKCLGALDAARDEEYHSNLLVSERLYKALSGLKGIGLYAQHEWAW